MLAATSTIPVPAFAIGIVAVGALLWLLMSAVDRIPLRRLYPPDPYRGLDRYPTPHYGIPTDEPAELVVPEPPLRYDLDRVPPRRQIIAASRRLRELDPP